MVVGRMKLVSTASQTLSQMLKEMDQALQDEIQAQRKDKNYKNSAVNGFLISEQSGHYVYQFTLESPWEPEEDAFLKIEIRGFPTITCSVVSANGITITVDTEEALPPEALQRIDLINDSTQLLEKLREVLKSTDEGSLQLGSKSFGLPRHFSFIQGKRVSPVSFGQDFPPNPFQIDAIQMALGSEVSYIIGPPGTGKTSTLAAIAFAHLCEGRTVLITAHTNIAVDNAIMKLADICRDTGYTQELSEGKILRYGTPQLKQLRESNRYAEVNIAKVANSRAVHLQQQHKKLEDSLDRAVTRRKKIIEDQQKAKEQWQETYTQHIHRRNNYQENLTLLEERERIRISPLQKQIHDLDDKISQAQQSISYIKQQATSLTSQQEQQRYRRNGFSLQASNLQNQLQAVQQMGSIKKFFKRTYNDKITEQLSETNYQLSIFDKELSDIEKHIAALHKDRIAYEQWYNQLDTSRQSVALQMTASSVSRQIENFRAEIARCTQTISFGPDGPQQNSKSLEQERSHWEREIERLQEQIAVIDEQMREIEKTILSEARVVSTTLSKTYMTQLRERRFDVVIIDEVSMAPLPVVYVVASRANQSVVALGDPYQLSPIVNAKTESAKKWLGIDLFTHNSITFQSAAKQGYGNSIILQEQSRMHPAISTIARKHIYKGGITDSSMIKNKEYPKIAPLPDQPLLLCNTSDANSTAIRPDNKGRINIYHALCSMAIAHQVLDTLPLANSPDNENPRVGIVTPYNKQAALLQRLIKDAHLEKLVRAGTIHKFQGLEFEVVIFDTVEAGSRPPYFTVGRHGSEAMRLVNVAVTRPKYKLIIVADERYISQKLNHDDILYLAVQEAKRADMIQSYEILDVLSPSAMRYSTTRSGPTGFPSIEHYNTDESLTRLQHDILTAESHVLIYDDFIAPQQLSTFESLIQAKREAGVTVEFIPVSQADSKSRTPPSNSPSRYDNEAEAYEKLAVIDNKIVHIDSSHAKNQNSSMLRVISPGLALELLKVKKGNEAKKEWATQNLNNLVRMGPPIRLPVTLLPEIASCKKCGAAMKARANGNTGQPFYSCAKWTTKECDNREQVSEIHLLNIQQLANKPCEKCNGTTRITNFSYQGLRIECSALTSCSFTQRIEFYK